MSILGIIHQGTKLLHSEAEKKAFLKRYQGNDLTLEDHYRHLCQLHPVYMALEEKMQSVVMKNSYNLSPDFEDLLHRSECIKKDMLFLKQKFPADGPAILPATLAYIKKIEAIDVSTVLGAEELFSHFLVRILGDLFGGQKLKEQVIRLYSMNRIYGSEVLSGVSLYEFEGGALRCFAIWLNSQTVSNEAALVAHCNESFAEHIKIFDELEATRLGAPLPTVSKTGLFGQYRPVAIAVAAVAATAVLAGTCALTEYCSLKR